MASAHDKILIVDFGSQVTQLIARRVREEGVYSEIVPFQKAEAAFKQMKPKAVILSGGPESVHEEGSPRAPQAIFDSGVPVLGICYGQMTMAAQLGGIVEGGHAREFGRADVEVKAASHLFDDTWGMGERHQVWVGVLGADLERFPRELEGPLVIAGVMGRDPPAVRQVSVFDAGRLILEKALGSIEPGCRDRGGPTGVILRQIHRDERGTTGLTRLQAQRESPLARADAEVHAAVPPGSLGQAF